MVGIFGQDLLNKQTEIIGYQVMCLVDPEKPTLGKHLV
jgi:hypothetical protein